MSKNSNLKRQQKRKKNKNSGVASRTTKAAKRGEYVGDVKSKNIAEARGKVTRKELLVVLVSVIVVVGMLLPSLAMITGQTGTTTDSQVGQSAQEIVTDYADNYEAAKTEADANPDDLDLQKNLGNMAYQYASWLPYETMFASTEGMSEDEIAEKGAEDAEKAQELYGVAYDSFNKWLQGQDDQGTVGAKNVRTSMAEILYAQGKNDESIAEFQKLIDEANWPTAWLGMGQIREQAGDTEGAIEAYNAAIENDPENGYGAKSTAEARIQSIQEAQAEAEATEDATTTEGVEVSSDGAEVTTTDGTEGVTVDATTTENN